MAEWNRTLTSGLVVGNASISASVSAEGNLFSQIIWNPPFFTEGENGLQNAGSARFVFTLDGKSYADTALAWTVTACDYPMYRAEAVFPNGVRLGVLAFAPLAAGDTEPMFMPAVLTEFQLTGSNSACAVQIAFEWDTALPAELPPKLHEEDRFGWAEWGTLFSGFSGKDICTGQAPVSLSAVLALPPERTCTLQHWFGCYPAEHRWRIHAETTAALNKKIFRSFSELKKHTELWTAALPRVGDPQIDRYTRWYTQAAVLLTKSDYTGRVITMGYKELNQRDSFWTSYLHLVFWPELEQAMLRESCFWQREDGKIPTTILPRYERERDIDINEYFCLRIARYFHYHRDWCFLRECWPHFTRAVEFLLSMDRDGDGLPEQAPPEDPLCFWADWKDVKGITGRKLAPHFSLLWLAVLHEGIRLADALQDRETAALYGALYEKAAASINRPAEDGGLWKEDHYTEQWYDGRSIPCVLLDQTVGMAFRQVSPEKADAIWSRLSRGETPAGIPETYPFRTEMEYAPGNYHNGGIWPFLTFCDCLGRYRYGNWRDAERLIRSIGYYDLELPGNWGPNEYLNGVTLENSGYHIQGWSAALFGTITHGAYQFEWHSDTTAEITVRFADRDFSTQLVLPQPIGTITLERRDHTLYADLPENCPVHLILRDCTEPELTE